MPGITLDIRNFRVRERHTIPEKEENLDICDNMNEPGEHYAM